MTPTVLHHFSERSDIEVFEPHVPRTNAGHPPAVRLVPALRPLARLVEDARWDFSIVRLANAAG